MHYKLRIITLSCQRTPLKENLSTLTNKTHLVCISRRTPHRSGDLCSIQKQHFNTRSKHREQLTFRSETGAIVPETFRTGLCYFIMEVGELAKVVRPRRNFWKANSRVTVKCHYGCIRNRCCCMVQQLCLPNLSSWLQELVAEEHKLPKTF